ncbi:MAG: branched-chain amino acid aminotransferase [Chitinophagales bacterium]
MQNRISITKSKKTKIDNVDFNDLGFGKNFTDHMFLADFKDGEWQNARIEPFRNFDMHPATSFMHYGQAIFEGLKATKNDKGETIIFRPDMNIKRMNISAKRMAMEEFPEELFFEALDKLLTLDEKWIPTAEGTSLYIRPFCFSSEAVVRIKKSESYTFCIILSPVGAYYAEPVSVYASEKYVRAFPGGTGFAKAAGNYGGAIAPIEEIKDKGFDQILWLDGIEKKYVQEIGTMNFAVVINGKVLTADLSEGTILPGITRDTALTLMKEMNIPFEERKVSMEEILEASKNGTLEDAFGMGTAAVISYIKAIGYKDTIIDIPPVSERKISTLLREAIIKQRRGLVEDTHNWIRKVNPVLA